MPAGTLITIEGLDGAGKTTLAEALAREIAARGTGGAGGMHGERGVDGRSLRGAGGPGKRGADAPGKRGADGPGERGADAPGKRGADAPGKRGAAGPGERQVVLLREPGGVQLSERIRELVKDPALTVGARAEALLYAAARAQLVQERLLPLLEEGALVLLDRFVDSSLAYQGAGRELGVEQIRAINLFATGGLQPDRTLLLRVSLRSGRARQGTRAGDPDRLELEGEEFFARIEAAYSDLARAEPRRIAVLDAELSPDRVLSNALTAIEDLL